jgi:hypothetical protein
MFAPRGVFMLQDACVSRLCSKYPRPWWLSGLSRVSWTNWGPNSAMGPLSFGNNNFSIKMHACMCESSILISALKDDKWSEQKTWLVLSFAPSLVLENLGHSDLIMKPLARTMHESGSSLTSSLPAFVVPSHKGLIGLVCHPKSIWGYRSAVPLNALGAINYLKNCIEVADYLKEKLKKWR